MSMRLATVEQAGSLANQVVQPAVSLLQFQNFVRGGLPRLQGLLFAIAPDQLRVGPSLQLRKRKAPQLRR